MPIPGISDIRIGSDAITRVLIGTEEIWSSGESPSYVEHHVFDPSEPYPWTMNFERFPPQTTY